MTVWFTADQHFGHKNIIKYCNRPFDRVEDMDETLIQEWNKNVYVDDTVFVIGDITLGNYDAWCKYLTAIHGFVIIIPGGHDWRWMTDYASKNTSRLAYIEVREPLITLDTFDPVIVLCHYAMRVWDRSHYDSWQLYGHSHGMLEPVGKQLDVGVDNIYKMFGSYRPLSLLEVTDYMTTRPHNENYLEKGGK